MNKITARKLHERRFRPSPFLTTGELLNLIGNEGLQEALLNRWIVPELESGNLMLNVSGGKLAELEEACRCHCGKLDCSCEDASGAAPTSVMPMRETFAAYGVSRPANTPTGGSPMLPAQNRTATPTSTPPPEQRKYKVGDPVVVDQDKTTYQGEISGFENDGRVRLRWRGQRPPEDRAYGPGEFLVTDAPANA